MGFLSSVQFNDSESKSKPNPNVLDPHTEAVLGNDVQTRFVMEITGTMQTS